MKITTAVFVAASTLAIGLVTPALAHQETAGTYSCIIEIKNNGEDPETLLGASVEGAGKGVIYQIVEKNGKFSSKPVEHGLVIPPHGSIELSPTTYQTRFGEVSKALIEDSSVSGTLEFEKLKTVPVHFMVEPDDTAPKEEPAPAAR